MFLDQGAALAFYILSALFFNSFVIIFVVTVLLAALDFWVVKNVSGRILVGLRWWNEINDLGESVWKFESLDQEVSFSSLIHKDMGSACREMWGCVSLSVFFLYTHVFSSFFYTVFGSDEQERLMAFLVDTLPCSKYFISNTSVAA